MNNLPLPPTDNLYKFLAIAGLLGVLASLTLITLNKRSLDAEIVASQSRAIEEWDKTVNELLKLYELHHGTNLPEGVATLRQETLMKSHKIRVALLNKAMTTSIKHTNAIACYCNITAIISALFTGFGFVRWYTKLQKFQDAMLSAKATTPSDEQNT